MAVRTVARRRRALVLTPRRVTLLLVLLLAGLQVVVALSAPQWARLLRRPVPAASDEEDAGVAAAATPLAQVSPEAARRINVKLFFEGPEQAGLVIEERAVAYHADLADQLRAVVEELFRGPTPPLVAPLAAESRVLEVFVTAGGCAYVDLSSETRPPQGAGSQEEMDAVYAIVNTLVVNFPAVTRVQLLVDDRIVDTFAGHVDLSQPLRGDLTLLAPLAVAPHPGPEEAAAPGAATPVPGVDPGR